MIREVSIDDAEKICSIYNYYVKNTIITFETSDVSVEEMKERIRNVKNDAFWYVFEENNEIYGYAYAAKWKNRCAYKNSFESTVYLNKEYTGKGIGTNLYKRLIDKIFEWDCTTLIAGIALPNEKSVALHEKLGFKKVAHFEEVGNKFNKIIDVGYWQLLKRNYSSKGEKND